MAGKIRLKLEQLEVSSFEPADAVPVARGTVRGHVSLAGGCTEVDRTCQNYGTCHYWEPCYPVP